MGGIVHVIFLGLKCVLICMLFFLDGRKVGESQDRDCIPILKSTWQQKQSKKFLVLAACFLFQDGKHKVIFNESDVSHH